MGNVARFARDQQRPDAIRLTHLELPKVEEYQTAHIVPNMYLAPCNPTWFNENKFLEPRLRAKP